MELNIESILTIINVIMGLVRKIIGFTGGEI